MIFDANQWPSLPKWEPQHTPWQIRGASRAGDSQIPTRTGACADSEEAYRKAIELDPCLSRAYANLAVLLCQHGRNQVGLDPVGARLECTLHEV